ncbi:MAG: 50S ribosomal protein L31 [Raoultibacter sp.]
MKNDIHPKYMECTVKCSCGNTFQTRSTVPELKLDICNACHPFYTGQQKLIDTGGRVQRFSDKFGGSAIEAVAAREAAKKAERAAATEAAEAKKHAEREAKAAEKAARAAKFAEKAAKVVEAAPSEEAVEAPAAEEAAAPVAEAEKAAE